MLLLSSRLLPSSRETLSISELSIAFSATFTPSSFFKLVAFFFFFTAFLMTLKTGSNSFYSLKTSISGIGIYLLVSWILGKSSALYWLSRMFIAPVALPEIACAMKASNWASTSDSSSDYMLSVSFSICAFKPSVSDRATILTCSLGLM